MSEEKPEIFIDEDWKSQVEKEKAESDEQAQNEAEAPKQDFSPFDHLVSTLAAQTMKALGLLGPEDQTQVTIDLDHAKFTIDTLMMLREKTKGNLGEAEESNLKEAISELQRVFASRVQQAHQAADDAPENTDTK